MMNKKSTTLAILLMMCSSHFILPATAITQQEESRLQTLWNLSKNNALTVAQFVENSASIANVIDRDIALLEKDKLYATAQKQSAQGFVYSGLIPGILGSVTSTATLTSVLGLILAGASLYAGSKVWHQENLPEGAYFGALRTLYGNNSSEVINERLRYLTKISPDRDYNTAALAFAGASPFVAVASIISAGIAKYFSNKYINYQQKNLAFITTMQERFDHDEIVIARLKDLKYNMLAQ